MKKKPRPTTWNTADIFFLSMNKKTKEIPVNMIGKTNSTVIAVLFNDDGNDDEDPVITSNVALSEVNVNTASIPDAV